MGNMAATTRSSICGRMVLSILSFIVLLAVCPAVHAQSDTWTYKEFARITKNGGTLFVLEVGMKSAGYDGYVRWRFTNKGNKTLYNIIISDKTYTLANGKTVDRSGEQVTLKLEPMDSKATEPDAVNSEENTGAYSDKNSNPAKRASFKGSIITFATEKDGTAKGWESYGTLEMR